MSLTRRALVSLTAAAAVAPTVARADTSTLRLGIQYGLTYLPFAVAQHERMIERQAKALGIGELQIVYNRSAGGTAQNDALLAGSLDCASTGFPSFLILWSKVPTRLAIKGLMSYGSTPLFLLTRNPAVKTLKDFTDADRIAVPAVKSSIQAMMLQMASKQEWGQFDKLDHLTVSRSHPDALVAMLSNSEIDSDFSAPPYQYQALAHKEIHTVTTSEQIFGGPSSNGLLYMTEQFHNANPGAVQALNLALREALALIRAEPKQAAQMYLEITNEKTDPALVLETITAPGTIWDAVPRGTMQFAKFMSETGAIAKTPSDWKGVFFPQAYDLAGS